MALNRQDLGRRLDQARREAGKTREQVCAALDITVNTWGSYVRGETDITAYNVARLAKLTGKTFAWFAGERVPVKRPLDQAIIARLVEEIARQRARLDEFERELALVSTTGESAEDVARSRAGRARAERKRRQAGDDADVGEHG